jgi:hypothetical protein
MRDLGIPVNTWWVAPMLTKMETLWVKEMLEYGHWTSKQSTAKDW